MHKLYKEKDDRWETPVFEDDKVCCPLQAADFFCNMYRQSEERTINGNQLRQPRIIDLMICRNLLPKKNPFSYSHIRNFKITISRLREQEKRQQRKWKRKGIRRIFYPFLHDPELSRATKSADVSYLI
jgi:hypothetical protein